MNKFYSTYELEFENGGKLICKLNKEDVNKKTLETLDSRKLYYISDKRDSYRVDRIKPVASDNSNIPVLQISKTTLGRWQDIFDFYMNRNDFYPRNLAIGKYCVVKMDKDNAIEMLRTFENITLFKSENTKFTVNRNQINPSDDSADFKACMIANTIVNRDVAEIIQGINETMANEDKTSLLDLIDNYFVNNNEDKNILNSIRAKVFSDDFDSKHEIKLSEEEIHSYLEKVGTIIERLDGKEESDLQECLSKYYSRLLRLYYAKFRLKFKNNSSFETLISVLNTIESLDIHMARTILSDKYFGCIEYDSIRNVDIQYEKLIEILNELKIKSIKVDSNPKKKIIRIAKVYLDKLEEIKKGTFNYSKEFMNMIRVVRDVQVKSVGQDIIEWSKLVSLEDLELDRVSVEEVKQDLCTLNYVTNLFKLRRYSKEEYSSILLIRDACLKIMMNYYKDKYLKTTYVKFFEDILNDCADMSNSEVSIICTLLQTITFNEDKYDIGKLQDRKNQLKPIVLRVNCLEDSMKTNESRFVESFVQAMCRYTRASESRGDVSAYEFEKDKISKILNLPKKDMSKPKIRKLIEEYNDVILELNSKSHPNVTSLRRILEACEYINGEVKSLLEE